jgi:hypothetical protein
MNPPIAIAVLFLLLLGSLLLRLVEENLEA